MTAPLAVHTKRQQGAVILLEYVSGAEINFLRQYSENALFCRIVNERMVSYSEFRITAFIQ